MARAAIVVGSLVVAFVLHGTAGAKTSRRECRAACTDRIQACRAAVDPFGIGGSACRRAILRACRQQGVAACATAITTTTATSTTTSSSSTTTLPSLLDGPYRDETIADWFTFVSYDDPTRATMILTVARPAGPHGLPPSFDSSLRYEMHVDNDHDGLEDVTVRFAFRTELRTPSSPLPMLGVGGGITAPANSPPPVAPGTAVLPPSIGALDGAGSEGLALRQPYAVTLIRGRGASAVTTDLTGSTAPIAVPANVGPRTIASASTLAQQGIVDLGGGVRVFAGTVDDPTYAARGAIFDTLNFFAGASTVAPGILSANQDADDGRNFAADAASGYDVEAIAIEVPITMLTVDGALHAAGDADAAVGTWATVARADGAPIHRRANPLVDELLVGIGARDDVARATPAGATALAAAVHDPLLARWLNAAYAGALPIPTPPRTDLDLLVAYGAPVCPACAPGPVADLLRVDLGVAPTSAPSRRRLGLLAGDPAGYPNGRRVSDDVTDIVLRLVAGVRQPGFDGFPNDALGDGVNTNDVPYREVFPYVGVANDRRGGRHVDPAEAGCANPSTFVPATCPSS